MTALQTNTRYGPSFMMALLTAVLVIMLYPYLQYYVDSDATAYLTITQRYASGHLQQAINGYWSPWSCWLTALWMRASGMEVMPAAIFINTIAAIGWLFISQSFFLLLGIRRKLQWMLAGTLALFLSYAVFKQNFDDLWECFFLLASLRVLLVKDYMLKQNLWVLQGLLGAMAYLAKAYAFPFFILQTLVCNYFLSHGVHTGRPVSWIKTSFIVIAVMLICSIPWLFMLHSKYGIWTTSTAGMLNLSWYTAGHPYYKEGIKYLLPPPYGNSPSYWEDAWTVNGPTPHFWDSGAMFIRQIVRICYNLLLFVKCLNEQSPFMLPATALAAAIFTSGKARNYFTSNAFIIAVSMLIFPLGFLMVNCESRYIWYMMVPGIVLSAVALQRILLRTHQRTTFVVTFIFSASFIAWPAYDLRSMWNNGKEQYDIAQQMKQQHIQGRITSNATFGQQGFDEIQQIAYFSGNPYYNMPYANVPYDSLLSDIRRYNVRYYFMYEPAGTPAGSISLHDETGKQFPVVATFNGLTVFNMQ